jgi:tripartite-type tricarboxylate transporter receptor subunit TctC
VQVTFASVATLKPHLKGGKIRALGVTTLQRSRLLPSLPSLAESGVPGLSLSGWYGLLGPAGTPQTVIEVVNRAIAELTDAARQYPSTPRPANARFPRFRAVSSP